ncbi:type IV pilus modification protein PilV [Pinirhizobacter sp.]|uniref:type IV pilus modification protein PilV n=1 Tax=Pinirhizobacter sp. TaxID=2950432 RepID=UPI002F427CCD
MAKSPSSRVQRGVSLLEVLVAIVIFSVGVLGLALMQLKGAQFTKQAGARTVAVLQARSLADAMRANPAGVFGVSKSSDIAAKGGDVSASYYKYTGGIPDPSKCGDDPCKVAAADITNWITQISTTLAVPVGTVGIASITPSTTRGTLTITTTWNGLSQSRDSTGTDTNNESYSFDYLP